MLRNRGLLKAVCSVVTIMFALSFLIKTAIAEVSWQAAFSMLSTKEQRKLGHSIKRFAILSEKMLQREKGLETIWAIDTKGDEPLFGLHVITVDGGTFTTSATFGQVMKLSKMENITYIELAKKFKLLLDGSIPRTAANIAHFLEYTSGVANDGDDVIVGIVDSGIDWAHEDFIDNDAGTSRILFLWDQVDSREYTQIDINDEIDGTPAGYVMEMDEEGHGTHVAGIAAGDGSAGSYPGKYVGMAPKADLIIVKTTLIDSMIVHGIDYIFHKADSLGKRAVINLSLGSQYGAHDGTDWLETKIDSLINYYGDPVVVAAGNEGSDPIHAKGTINSDTVEVKVHVPPYAPDPTYWNRMDINMWYPNVSVLITIETPSGARYGPVATGAVDSFDTAEGYIYLDNASKGLDPNNGQNSAELYVFDYHVSPHIPPASGDWTIILSSSSSGVDFDAYIDFFSMFEPEFTT